MKQETIAFLHRLSREEGVLYSRLSLRIKKDIDPLLDAKVLRRYPAGRGARLYVEDEAALRSVLNNHPLRDLSSVSHLPPKTQSAYLHGSTKTKRLPSSSEVLIFRGLDYGEGLTLRTDELTLDATLHSKKYGVASIEITVDDDWHSEGRIALIENNETFCYPEFIYGLHLYNGLLRYNGNMSKLFLNWLSYRRRFDTIYIFPDYDPVGLSNAVRLIEQSKSNVEVVIPTFLELLFETHPNEETYRENIALMRNLRPVLESRKDLSYIVHLMEKYGAGVEQEMVALHVKKQYDKENP